jgi:peptidyl-prolyl cis-trans isomerase D
MVSDDAIDKALLNYPGYLDDNGKFSEQRWQAVAASEKANTRKLYQENLASNVFVNDVVSGVQSGSKETAFITAMAKPERSFSFVSWPFADFPKSEVQKFGEANKARFTRIKVSRILVKSGESQAKEIRKKIVDKTSSFEELAKTYSKDAYADKGGDMGWRYAYDLEADFEVKDAAQKVLTLKNGELSDVLKGTYGWMFYRCDAESVDSDFANDQVLSDVRAYINTYEKGKVEDYFNERATQLSRRSAEIGFDKAVRETSSKAYATDFFPVNLGNIFSFAPLKAIPESETPNNATYSEDFFYRAFTLGKDQVSAPVMLDDRAIVLKLTGEQELAQSTAAILGNFISYVASQSLQSDLQATLMTPDKLEDNFIATFTRDVMPPRSKQ